MEPAAAVAACTICTSCCPRVVRWAPARTGGATTSAHSAAGPPPAPLARRSRAAESSKWCMWEAAGLLPVAAASSCLMPRDPQGAAMAPCPPPREPRSRGTDPSCGGSSDAATAGCSSSAVAAGPDSSGGAGVGAVCAGPAAAGRVHFRMLRRGASLLAGVSSLLAGGKQLTAAAATCPTVMPLPATCPTATQLPATQTGSGAGATTSSRTCRRAEGAQPWMPGPAGMEGRGLRAAGRRWGRAATSCSTWSAGRENRTTCRVWQGGEGGQGGKLERMQRVRKGCGSRTCRQGVWG